MAEITPIQLPHLPDYVIYALLFRDVTNAAFLKQQLLAGNADFEYAFLDATKILSVSHVLAAVFRAINDKEHGRLKSRNVHSEIVFSLNPNNNIAESFRRFGISDTTTHLLAIKVLPSSSTTTTIAAADNSPSTPSTHLQSTVQGSLVPFTDESIRQSADLPQIRKLYKLDTAAPSKAGRAKGRKDVEDTVNGVDVSFDDVAEMEAVVLGIMALKGS